MSAVITRTVRSPFALMARLWRRLVIRCQLHWLENDCEHLRQDIRDNPEVLRIKLADMQDLRNEQVLLRD